MNNNKEVDALEVWAKEARGRGLIIPGDDIQITKLLDFSLLRECLKRIGESKSKQTRNTYIEITNLVIDSLEKNQ